MNAYGEARGNGDWLLTGGWECSKTDYSNGHTSLGLYQQTLNYIL